MNRLLIIINININLGRNYLLGHCLKIITGNVLGALFRWLTVGRKDTGFGGKSQI